MEEDFEKLKSLAERGIAHAQYRLGLMYSGGTQVPQDLIIAHKWFNLSAMGGEGKALEERQNIAAIMSEEEVSSAQKLAREWKKSHKSSNFNPRIDKKEGDRIYS